MRLQLQRLAGITVVGSLLALAGCGGDGLHYCRGQVTLDGQPLAGAALVFMPVAGGRPAQAVTDAEGRFEAWTFEPGDGALLGEHHVTVSRVTIVGVQATEHGLEGPSQGPVRTESSLPSRYGNAAISGLSAQVKPGEDNFVELALSSR